MKNISTQKILIFSRKRNYARSLFLIILFFIPLAFCSADEIDERPYERFIGLGNHCITRSQIDLHLIDRFGLDKESFGGGQLFDWLVIHNYRKLAKAIENDLSDLFDQSDLMLIAWNDVFRCVTNIKYEMAWNHLFTRNSDLSLADNVIELEYDLKKQKIDYLTNKFKNLSQYRTLYIISYSFDKSYLGKEPSAVDLLYLQMTLAKMRGNENFDILYISSEKKFNDFPHIFVRELPDTGLDIALLNPFWNSLLAQFPFKLDEEL